jgi:hypothetical protein
MATREQKNEREWVFLGKCKESWEGLVRKARMKEGRVARGSGRVRPV